MSDPKIGMHYEEVRKRVRKYEKFYKEGKIKNVGMARNMQDSLINQARLKDGEGAAKELRKELRKDFR